jgi:hypothetical protein
VPRHAGHTSPPVRTHGVSDQGCRMCCCTFILSFVLCDSSLLCLKEVHARILLFARMGCNNARFKEWLRTRVGSLVRFQARSGTETVSLTGTVALDKIENNLFENNYIFLLLFCLVSEITTTSTTTIDFCIVHQLSTV